MKQLTTIIFAFFITFNGISQNQGPTNEPTLEFQKSIWLELGFGKGGQDMAGQINLNVEIKKDIILSAGIESVTGAWIFATGDYKAGDAYSLRLGKVKKFKGGLISIEAGPSLVNTFEFHQPVLFGFL